MNRRGFKAAARQCIRDAAYSTKKVTLVFLLILVGLFLLDMGVSALMERIGTSGGNYLSDTVASESRNYLIVFLVSLVCQLLSVIFQFGYASFSLKLSRGEDFSLRTLLSGFDRWGKTLLLYVIMNLYIALWSMLLVVPLSYVVAALYMAETLSMEAISGVIFVCSAIVTTIFSYRYRMSWFVMLDHPELSASQTLRLAQAINRKHRWELFVMDLSFLPLVLLCLLTCGVLLIWKLPCMTASYAHAYNALTEDYHRRQQQIAIMLEEQEKRFRQ